jgi:secretion/DNA translocation related TadE-like protein
MRAIRRSGRRDERGAGTVLAVAMLGVIVTVTVATAGVVAVVAGHRRAQAAGDLAALAGATALQDGADACARAGRIAARNGTSLRACAVRGWEVRVTVVEEVSLPVTDLELRARARAGPVLSAPAP